MNKLIGFDVWCAKVVKYIWQLLCEGHFFFFKLFITLRNKVCLPEIFFFNIHNYDMPFMCNLVLMTLHCHPHVKLLTQSDSKKGHITQLYRLFHGKVQESIRVPAKERWDKNRGLFWKSLERLIYT